MSSESFALPPIECIVIDTNVVLDWLVFRNAGCESFVRELLAGRLQWLATAAMRDELAHVLARGFDRSWNADHDAIWAAWNAHTTQVPVVASSGTASRVRCSDIDDQKFIDLALASGARWLLSRDRAVLKLARRSRAFGLDIVTPKDWAALRSRAAGH
jgi:predicted nucleic acid-binding protein